MKIKRKRQFNLVVNRGLKKIRQLKRRGLKRALTIAQQRAPEQLARLKKIKNSAALRFESIKIQYRKINRVKRESGLH